MCARSPSCSPIGSVVELDAPSLEKNTAGYAFAHDPVDSFVGSEGTLGVVVEAELALLPAPEHVVGLAIPFASERDALAFVVAAREDARRAAALSRILRRPRDSPSCATVQRRQLGDRADAWSTSEEELPASDEATSVSLDRLARARRASRRASTMTIRRLRRRARTRRRACDAACGSGDDERARRCDACRIGGRKVSTDWAVPYRRCGSHRDARARLPPRPESSRR